MTTTFTVTNQGPGNIQVIEEERTAAPSQWTRPWLETMTRRPPTAPGETVELVCYKDRRFKIEEVQ